ncbi:hypothetical protein C8J56DRAFT_1063638 [Mycena floridula]|nr:hypothetical protein C8J56DRAFT_1063638 [Mycena floridula]
MSLKHPQDQCNKVQGSIFAEMHEGQTIDLNEDYKEYFTFWKAPYPNGSALIKAYNRTSLARTMSIGVVRGHGNTFSYEPTFVWLRTGVNMCIEAELIPKILCYVNLGYQETEIIRGDISSDLIYTIDVMRLSGNATFIFEEGPQGTYNIFPLEKGIDPDGPAPKGKL